MPIASDRHLNKCYITSSLNTVKVYKTHDQYITRTLQAHYIVTYVMPNFVFPLFVFHQLTWISG